MDIRFVTLNVNTEALSGTRNEVGLEVNADKTTYVDVSSPECRAKS
jgi:hypothetical protein